MLTYIELGRLVLNVMEELDQYDQAPDGEQRTQMIAFTQVVRNLNRKLDHMKRAQESHDLLQAARSDQLAVQCPHPAIWMDDDVFVLGNKEMRQCLLCNDAVEDGLPF